MKITNNTIIGISVLSFLLWAVSSWLTHIIVCIQNSEWGFMIAGAILVPIAWIHGTGIWFGFW